MTEPISISRYLTAYATENPDQPAVTCGERTVTWRELESSTNLFARELLRAGAEPGRMLTIGYGNGIPFIEACIACWKIGATPQPLPSRLPPRERDALIELVDPSLILGLATDDDLGRPVLPPGFTRTETDDSILPDAVSPAWRAIASGGSTGRPKIVVSAASSMMGEPGSDLTIIAKQSGASPARRMLFPAPLYHSGSFGQALPGLFSGAHLILMEKFDPEGVLATIQRHQVQWAFLVPTMMARIWKLPTEVRESYDLSTLEALWHAAAPCPPWLKEAWIDWLGAERIFESYGASDAAGYTVIRGDDWLTHRGSVGRAVIGDVLIADDDGKQVPPGVVGEIFMRPPDEAMRRVYIGAPPQKRIDDAWSVGDLGYMDEDGFLYIADRRVDLIISGAVNVYPAEVEAALEEHPDVVTAVVVGVPDDDLGKRVHALVQVAPASDVDEEGLAAFVRERLVRHKVPRTWELTTEPIRDEAGKARRSGVAAAVIDKETTQMGATT